MIFNGKRHVDFKSHQKRMFLENSLQASWCIKEYSFGPYSVRYGKKLQLTCKKDIISNAFSLVVDCLFDQKLKCPRLISSKGVCVQLCVVAVVKVGCCYLYLCVGAVTYA